jgi:hypothetical protein
MVMKLPRNPVNGWIVASVGSPWLNGWYPCMEWCRATFEDANWQYVGVGIFEFRRADDHMMFVLRWA